MSQRQYRNESHFILMQKFGDKNERYCFGWVGQSIFGIIHTCIYDIKEIVCQKMLFPNYEWIGICRHSISD